MRRAVKPLILYIIGGLLYMLTEILWRGRTHWTMFIIGGICFLFVGLINEVLTWDMPLIRQMALSAVFITIMELLAGLLINCNYTIWDYRQMPLNIMGQICLPYTILWFFLSLPAIVIDDYLRYWIFKDKKPHYTLFKEGEYE